MENEKNKLIELRKQAYTKNRTIVLSSIGLIVTIIMILYIFGTTYPDFGVPGNHPDPNICINDLSNFEKNIYHGFIMPCYLLFIFFCALLPSITISIVKKRKTNSIKSIESALKAYYDEDFTVNQLKEPKYNNESFIFKFTNENKKEYKGKISVSDTESTITTNYNNEPIIISHEKIKCKFGLTITIAYIIIIILSLINITIVSTLYGTPIHDTAF